MPPTVRKPLSAEPVCNCDLQNLFQQQNDISARLEDIENLLADLVIQQRGVKNSEGRVSNKSTSMAVAKQMGTVLLYILKKSNKDHLSGKPFKYHLDKTATNGG